jgi:Ca2+-binding RTX toxin-like protein
LFGRLGGDTLTGGLGADQFSYFGEAESSGADFDRLVGFDDDTDYLQVMATSFAAPVSGSLDAATMGTTLEVAFAALGPGAAGVFTATGGDMAGRTFLLVDAVNAAGYQHGGDYLFEMVAPVTPIDNLAMFT